MTPVKEKIFTFDKSAIPRCAATGIVYVGLVWMSGWDYGLAFLFGCAIWAIRTNIH